MQRQAFGSILLVLAAVLWALTLVEPDLGWNWVVIRAWDAADALYPLLVAVGIIAFIFSTTVEPAGQKEKAGEAQAS